MASRLTTLWRSEPQSESSSIGESPVLTLNGPMTEIRVLSQLPDQTSITTRDTASQVSNV